MGKSLNNLTESCETSIIIFNFPNVIIAMTENYELQAKLFKALMHPARLAILDILRSGEECVCHLEAALGCRQAYISQHLMFLRDAGLIQDRREGWNIFYRVIKPEVFALIDASHGILGESSAAPGENPRPRQKVSNCPCRKCNPELNKGNPDESA